MSATQAAAQPLAKRWYECTPTCRWSPRSTPVQHMTLPLLREPFNHPDYQLGLTTTAPNLAATTARVAPTFWAWEEPLAANTRTHEAALAVLYWTGVTTLFDPYYRYADLAATRVMECVPA